MGWRPQLNVTCSRCGKAHGPFGVCVNPRRRKGTIRVRPSFGNCPGCKKPYGPAGPLAHVCAKRSDFKKRKKAYETEQATAARKARAKAREAHDFRQCKDDACERRACKVWKEALALGEQRGREKAEERAAGQLQEMYRLAYARGRAECPREHKLGDHRA